MLIKMKLLPLLKHNLKTFCYMSLILSMGIFVLTGLGTAYVTLSDTFDNYYEDYRTADISLFTTMAGSAPIGQLKRESGIKDVNKRLSLNMLLEKEDKRGINCSVIGLQQDPSVNEIYFLEKIPKKEAGKTYVYLERDFFQNNKFSIGDTLYVYINGKKKSLTIGGYVGSPECAVVTRDTPFSFDSYDYGIIYMDYDQLIELSGLPKDSYNQLLIKTADENTDDDDKLLLDTLKTAEYLPEIQYSYVRQDSPYKDKIDTTLKPLKQMSFIFPGLLFSLTLLVLYLFLYQIIMDQKKEIGIFRALGASVYSIAGLYSIFALLVSAVGLILGIGSGILLSVRLSQLYADLYILPKIYWKTDWQSIGIAIFLAVFIGQTTILLAIKNIIKERPVELMGLHKAGRTVTKRMRYLSRCIKNEIMLVCMHSVLRNKKRTALAMLTILLASAIMMISMSLYNASNHIRDYTFEKQLLYDCQVKTKEWINQDKLDTYMKNAEGINQYEPSMLETALINYHGKEQKVTINGISTESIMVSLVNDKLKTIDVEKNGIVLDQHTAGQLGVTIGDKVEILGKEIQVTGISFQASSYIQYCSYQTFNRIFERGGDSFNLIFADMEDKEAETECYEEFKDWDSFDFIVFKEIQKKGADRMISLYYSSVYAMVIFAFLSGMLIIYNISVININERIYDFCILRTLGASSADIIKISFTEQILLNILPVAAGTLLGSLAGTMVFKLFDSKIFSFKNMNTITTYAFIGFLAFTFICIGYLGAAVKIRKANLAESLKDRE